MSILSLILSTLVILWSPFNTASQVEFPSIDAFLKSTLKGEDKLNLDARGDLNGDGQEDWAGVIDSRNADNLPTSQLYVLLRLPQGGYRVAEKSQEVELGGTGCCWFETLEIRQSSLYIQFNSKDGKGAEAAKHQFKLYQGQWRLIGLIIYHTDFSFDPPVTIDTDMNLLTGSVIEKKQKGDDKPTTSRRHKRFPTYLLKNFEFGFLDRFGKDRRL
jgi:hypothetical protein